MRSDRVLCAAAGYPGLSRNEGLQVQASHIRTSAESTPGCINVGVNLVLVQVLHCVNTKRCTPSFHCMHVHDMVTTFFWYCECKSPRMHAWQKPFCHETIHREMFLEFAQADVNRHVMHSSGAFCTAYK